MHNLDPKTLAEGRRLLKAYDERGPINLARKQAALSRWAVENMRSLLSAAEQASKAEACLREIVEEANGLKEVSLEQAKNHPMTSGQIARESEAETWSDVQKMVREIAARHGFDLGEAK